MKVTSSLPTPRDGEQLVFKFDGHQQQICSNLFSMWQKMQLCDLTFKLSRGNEIRVHSTLMAACSPTIADILSRVDTNFHKKGELSQKCIILDVNSRFSLQVMNAIVRLIYTGQLFIPVTTSIVLTQLLEASRWLKIEKLVKLFENCVGSGKLSNFGMRENFNVTVLSLDGSVILDMKSGSDITISKENDKAPGSKPSSISTPKSLLSQTIHTTSNSQSSSSVRIFAIPSYPSVYNTTPPSAQKGNIHQKDSCSSHTGINPTMLRGRDSSRSNSKPRPVSLIKVKSIKDVSSLTHSMKDKDSRSFPVIKLPILPLSQIQKNTTSDVSFDCHEKVTTKHFQEGRIISFGNFVNSKVVSGSADNANCKRDNSDSVRKDEAVTAPKILTKSYPGPQAHNKVDNLTEPPISDFNHFHTDVNSESGSPNQNKTPAIQTQHQLGHTNNNEDRQVQKKNKMSEPETEYRAKNDNDIMISTVIRNVGAQNERAMTEAEVEDAPEVKMEVDDWSDFVSSCDELNSVNSVHMANPVEVEGVNEHTGEAEGRLAGCYFDGNTVETKTEIKEEMCDEEIKEEVNNIESLISSCIDDNHSLLHDHVYLPTPENPLVNRNDEYIKDGEDGRKNRVIETWKVLGDETRSKSKAHAGASCDSDSANKRPAEVCSVTKVEERYYAREPALVEQCPGLSGVAPSGSDQNPHAIVSQDDCFDLDLGAQTELTASFWCDLCNAPFTKEAYFQEHINNHPVFSCSKCPAKFYRHTTLKNHFKSLHDFSSTNIEEFQKQCQQLKRIATSVYNSISSTSQIYKCEDCLYVAKNAISLCQHSSKEHKQPRPFKCHYDECKYRGKQLSRILQHLKDTHATGKNVTCDNCQAKCKNMATYKAHRKTCLKLVKLLCNFCGKTFNSSQNLRTHMEAIHGRAQKFKCDRCLRKFSCRGNLNRHMRVHNETFPYPCSRCKRKFRHSNTLKSHLTTMH